MDWTVHVYPITVTLTGTTEDSSGNQQILVGQGCTASIVGIPSGTGWKTTYQWSVSGTTFQNWLPQDPGNPDVTPKIPANPQASLYDPGPGTQTNPTYHWYWNDLVQAPETVTCTATVTPPAGQGAAFQVTAKQNVMVYIPTLNTNMNSVGAGFIAPYKPTYPLWLVAEPSNAMKGLGYSEGSTWTTAVSLPSIFASSGSGTYGYAQLIVPGIKLVDINGVSHPGAHNGFEGLDGSFPYFSDTYSTDGRSYNDGDSPALPVDDVEMTEQVADTFHTYLMFRPPGSDTKWVPLAVSAWLTNLNASLPSTGHWSDYPSNKSAGTVELIYNFVPQNTFPSWKSVF